MSYPVRTCNAGELLTDGDFPNAPGAWAVGTDWRVPGDGFAYFNGISVGSFKISQTITLIENHVLEIHLSVVGAFFSLGSKGLHIKIGGWTSPLITAVGSYVFYPLPSNSGSQLFEITSDTPNYGPADFAIMSHVSCVDTVCTVNIEDLNLTQPNLYYDYWPIADNKIMLQYSARFDKTSVLVIHDPDWP